MGANQLRCDCGHQFYHDWFTLILNWTPDFKCHEQACTKPLRWFNQWRPPRARPSQQPLEYEVLFVARLDDAAPLGDRWSKNDEGYLPVLLLCRDSNGTLNAWPRYWVRPDAVVRFGQDGPLLTIEEWEYLFEKMRRFVDESDLGVHMAAVRKEVAQ